MLQHTFIGLVEEIRGEELKYLCVVVAEEDNKLSSGLKIDFILNTVQECKLEDSFTQPVKNVKKMKRPLHSFMCRNPLCVQGGSPLL